MSSRTTIELGTVESLWRYPVKSMGGESLEEASILNGGILGDRAYALIDDSNGKVASAKHPAKWARLLKMGANYLRPPDSTSPPPPVQITLANGAEINSNEDKIDALLSEQLGRAVTLTRIRPESVSLERVDPLLKEESIQDTGALMMEGRFTDYAAIHLVTTATLSRLAELAPESNFDVKRFRPNLLIDTGDESNGFLENNWVGIESFG